jgi:hypothetical protein
MKGAASILSAGLRITSTFRKRSYPMSFFCASFPYKYKDMGLELTPLVRKNPEVERLLLKEISLHGVNPLKLKNA